MLTDKTPKEALMRALILMVGLTIAHFGVTLFLLSRLGADPFNVLVEGLFKTASRLTGLPFLTHGRVHIVISFLIILVLLIVDRSYIRIGTVLCMVFGGPIIDIFTALLSPLSGMDGLLPRSLMLVAGCVILAFGMTIVIKSEAGTGPNDLVGVVISDKTGKPFSVVRVIVDVSFVIAGTLLGGIFGPGTLVCAALVGPVAGIFLPVSERAVRKIIAAVLKEQS